MREDACPRGKKMMWIWLLLPALMLRLFAVSALASGDAVSPPPEAEAAESVLDPAELSSIVEQLYVPRNNPGETFALGYCYTGTGETWFYNPDEFIGSASLYKLPLVMLIANQVHEGILDQDGQVYGYDVNAVEQRALTYSENEIAEVMVGYLNDFYGSFRNSRTAQARMAGVREETLPEVYYESFSVSARFMLSVLNELYCRSELYPNVIDCMLEANPGQYFRQELEGRYDVAQKYGGGENYLHTAGIIYTDTPFLLVVMTYNVYDAMTLIGRLAERLAEYTQSVDQRIADAALQEELAAARDEALERQAAEEAARAEAEAKRAAEEAERQRLAAEEAERAREEQRRQEEARAAEEARIKETERLVIRIVAGGVAGLLAICLLFRSRKKRK